jgi:[protein-PII] uridylyltransferase
MRSPLRAKREALEDHWQKGLSGQALLRGHSKAVDEFIQECFQTADVAGVEELVSVVALGGYGRQELFPFSDVDLMIVFRPEVNNEEISEIANSILYPLWDSGLEVGHGVRSVEEAISLAEEDFYFRVAMLDARLLCGSQLLYFTLLSDYREKFVEGQRRDFVETMERFRSERREKFGSHSFLLEPHIKEGKGGLRDIQAMLWTARVMYGLEGLQGIVNAGILTEEEHDMFVASWDTLVRVRNRLHYISRRKNDQLYFEQQEEIAEALSYRDDDGFLGVEVFMREMYGHMQNIAVVTDLFFAHVADILGLGADNGKVPDKVIETGIELRGNTVHLIASPDILSKKPHLLLRVFLAAARYGVPVHHRSLKAVSANLDLITDKVRNSARAAQSFLAILEIAEDAEMVLGSMLDSGLLCAYIPEFSRIVTLVQHDIYHIYTVDRHSLHAVGLLHRVVAEQDAAFEMVASPRVLFLATLLHDIGKGSGRDHSEEGAEIALKIGRRMGFSEDECQDLWFVIKHHLYMPENALRRDLNDSEFIRNCAEIIGTSSHLAMLYLIAIADSKATGPSAWSEWKSQLLQSMFQKVKPYLEHSVFDRAQSGFVKNQVEQGVLWLRQQVAELLVDEADLKVCVDDLTDDYLLSFPPEFVAQHVLIHRDNYRLLRQKSLVYASEKEGQWSLLIMSSDQPGLLAKICGVMTLNNLTVLNAQIFTWSDGTVVDVLDVRPTDGLGYEERDWSALNVELDLAITYRLGLSHRLYKKLAAAHGRKKDLVSRHKPRVIINNEASTIYTVIEVYGNDREGQLYRVTQTLADFGINIFKAFIATEVERSIDVFYVLDRGGNKIKELEFKGEIIEGVLHCISGNEGNK